MKIDLTNNNTSISPNTCGSTYCKSTYSTYSISYYSQGNDNKWVCTTLTVSGY